MARPQACYGYKAIPVCRPRVCATNFALSNRPSQISASITEHTQNQQNLSVVPSPPDRTTPFEETFRAVNKLHQEGYFDRFGISNYMSWEVAYINDMCVQNGWIQPSVYQGVYNSIHRTVEGRTFSLPPTLWDGLLRVQCALGRLPNFPASSQYVGLKYRTELPLRSENRSRSAIPKPLLERHYVRRS
jgi:hypothetical protein